MLRKPARSSSSGPRRGLVAGSGLSVSQKKCSVSDARNAEPVEPLDLRQEQVRARERDAPCQGARSS